MTNIQQATNFLGHVLKSFGKSTQGTPGGIVMWLQTNCSIVTDSRKRTNGTHGYLFRENEMLKICLCGFLQLPFCKSTRGTPGGITNQMIYVNKLVKSTPSFFKGTVFVTQDLKNGVKLRQQSLDSDSGEKIYFQLCYNRTGFNKVKPQVWYLVLLLPRLQKCVEDSYVIKWRQNVRCQKMISP